MGKRLTGLSLKDKLKIIDAATNKKQNKKELCRIYKCDISTINRTIKNSEAIYAAAGESANLKKKRQRQSNHSKLEKALALWFDTIRQSSGTITNNMLLLKAKEFAVNLREDFVPDNSWLWRWRKRNGIKFAKIHGEAAENDAEAAADYRSSILPSILSKFSAENVFNADESGLFYKALPNTTYARSSENPKGNKQQKARLTILFICNATGTFKRLYVIGKSEKPRCFKNKHVPVEYFSNKKAWMTAIIWNKILKSLDVELAEKGKHIVLFVDNAACHKVNVELTNIKVHFLPPNTTAIIQPLDQGIIHSFKMHYRQFIVRKQILAIEKGKTVKQFCKSISIYDAIQFIVSAWKLVKPESIANCFKKGGFSDHVVCEEADDSELEILCDDLEYIHLDDNIQCFGSLNEDEVLEQLMNDIINTSGSDIDCEDEIVQVDAAPPTIKEALSALEVVQKFCECYNIELNGNKIEKDICKVLVQTLGQKKITDFFKLPVA